MGVKELEEKYNREVAVVCVFITFGVVQVMRCTINQGYIFIFPLFCVYT